MGSPFFPLINLEKLVLGLIVFLGALSYYTLYPSARDYLTSGPANYWDKNMNFYSFRSAVVALRGNRHDKASYDYLDKRVKDFERFFMDFKNKRMNLLNSQYWDAIYSGNKDYKEERATTIADWKEYEVRIFKILRQRHVPANKFKGYLDDQVRRRQIPQETYEQAVKYLNLGDRKLAYFEVAAPVIDNFYLRDDNLFTIATVGVHPARLAPIQHLTYSSFQYYLRDEYSFFIHSGSEITGTVFPIGKKHELSGPFFYVALASYPSKNITSHLRALYSKSHIRPHEVFGHSVDTVIPEAKEHHDFFIQNMGMKFIRPDPSLRKLLNIYGIDFVSFFQYYLDQKMNPDQNPQVLEDLHSQGFEEFEFPESYRAFLKFPKMRQMRVFTNPQSYGRAYVAKWAKVIRPEDNLANEGILSLGKFWPRSKVLAKNFEKHMSSLPKDIWRSIIVESSDLKDQKELPQVFGGDNRVDIKKLIASKAVFDVDCQDEQCWFVYNTTVLNGWKAYSGSEKLPVNKANLGFIGLKLNKGKQLVWLEYAPLSLVLGLLITLTGWFLFFALCLKQGSPHGNDQRSYPGF